MSRELPYGTWPSPVSPEMLTTGAIGLVDVWVDDGRTVWLESRPAEAGRLQIVALDGDGTHRDVLPDGFSARSGVHEYGGGAAWVEGGWVWFVNWVDQRLYVMPLDGSRRPQALTPDGSPPRAHRYADMRRSPDGAWIVCVRERHTGDDESHDVSNDVVLVRAHEPSDAIVVFDGSDFVMSPRFVGHDWIRLVAWDQPDMPWDSTRVIECTVDPGTGRVGPSHTLADGAAYMQPTGEYVVSDRSGWWNVWRLTDDAEQHVAPIDAEVGGPAWVFGDRSFVALDDGRLVYSTGSALRVDGASHSIEPAALEQFVARGTAVTAIARFTDRNPAIVRLDADRPDRIEIVVPPLATDLDPTDIAVPTEIRYPTPGGVDAFGWFYPPTNARHCGPDGVAPPLVTMIHGGPTSDAVPFFSLARQFWTSRGFAVVDVNHRGSTGYGRAFRSLLDGQWGVVDVEDCCAAATWLAEQGWVDASRMVIRGGSAGGLTVLSCLARSDVFAAGASSFGVADLMALAADTHKFEARYLDRLVGPLPECRALYDERSPIHQLDRFHRPLIVFQGADDMVVPPSQSEAVVAALRDKGIECDYHLYPGEGHGFRNAATIVHQLTSELDFYRRILDLG